MVLSHDQLSQVKNDADSHVTKELKELHHNTSIEIMRLSIVLNSTTRFCRAHLKMVVYKALGSRP